MVSSPIRRNAYQCVLQLSEEDCGAACLASICKYYGRLISISRSREAVGTGQLGTTLLGLKRGFENLGFKTRSVKASPDILDRLKELPLPGVIHWKGYHWVVLYGKRGNKYIVADPALGIRYLKRAELVASWNGIMLLLEPDVASLSQQSETDTATGFGRFLGRILPYRGLIFGVLLINIVLGILSLASPFLLQILTDDVLVRQDTQLLTVVIVAVVVMTLFNGALQLLQSTLVAHFSQRLQLGFVLDFGRKILNLPLSYYETRRSGEIVSRLRDINEINQLVSQIVALLPSQFFVAFISFCFMVFYSWKLTLAVTLIGVLMTCSTLPFMPILQQATRKLLVLSSENQGVLVETFKGALVIKATNAAPQFWEEFQTRFGRLANITFNTVQISIVNGIFSQMVSSIGSISLLGFGSLLVISKELSIGQLLAFNSLQGNVLALMGSLIGLVDEYYRTQTAVTRLGEVIDATPEITTTTQKPHAQLPGSADIICKSLNFHHAGRLELMEDFSVTLPGGCAIALIGRSGCGKSTLAKLIAGLYQPNSGNIRIDCFNLQDLSLECLRQQIVYVPQDPHFWSRSIIENFRLGTPYISFEQIVKACQIADADDFISQLPNKYQTVLGEFGANLSGGQRQRLAIARGIVTDPPILILDESTAGLDPVSETNVLDKLLAYRKGRTTIMITHRPSVIERADWVTLLDKGKVLVQGDLQKLRSFPGEHLKFISY
ncbi:ABC transporter ATP-binding protein [Nostoc minutum NIES-26]|uniref:ABC transporter ATP-binding protein n=1 Tax=Nostoc minutum NIES-26 TaxID=1844469 RepID=A0A367Q4E0_9NOSO|nr:peptidase domain-containing ABC transporter [Dendronalium sp. ChiSLP03b]MDZ8203387.1 peptidase domain-containing ABC transporter [Dendronalium sp. ChiSLP03b]RCJ18915.1 ABC transporter ATP-binding protein [Nostoc minutum NIES-26]